MNWLICGGRLLFHLLLAIKMAEVETDTWGGCGSSLTRTQIPTREPSPRWLRPESGPDLLSPRLRFGFGHRVP